jgi:hypothetical protein
VVHILISNQLTVQEASILMLLHQAMEHHPCHHMERLQLQHTILTLLKLKLQVLTSLVLQLNQFLTQMLS